MAQEKGEPRLRERLKSLIRSFPDEGEHNRYGTTFSHAGVMPSFISSGDSLTSVRERMNYSFKPSERSQWDFEEDFKSNTDDYDVQVMFQNQTWSTWPFWRVGVELRRIVLASKLAVSVVARLAVLYHENDERERVDMDLLPPPLNELSAEDEVDSILQEWEDQPADEAPSLILTEQLHRLGEESWVFVMICVLNYMNTGRDLKQMQLAAMQGVQLKRSLTPL